MPPDDRLRSGNPLGLTPLIPAEQIAARVAELGRQITDDYPERSLTLLGVLTGSLVFVADLMRRIDRPLKLGLLQASSYRGEATTPGELRIEESLLPDVEGRDVLLVDDIFDTGRTLSAAMDRLRERRPASLRSAVLLWKRTRTVVDLVPDYVGFEIPDAFVVGYGLDYNDEFRHLPYIGVVNTDGH